MNLLESQFILLNKKYIGTINTNNFQSDIYKCYYFNYLDPSLPR